MARWMFVIAAMATACGPAGGPAPATAPRPPDLAQPRPAARPLPAAPAALDDNVAPVAYRLELELDPAARGFRGAIEIDVRIARPTRAIWLHAAADLKVTPTAASADGGALAIEGFVPAGGGDIVGVVLAEPRAGAATLRLEMSGDYRDRDGIFAQRAGGDRFVYTDFEPVDARRAFPCFDLPRWRAPWTITVRVPDGVGAYANTAETSETREGALVTHRFATTAPLPTYLVAIAAGRFTVVDVPDAPVPARILVPGRADSVAFAASLVGPILDASVRTIGRPLPWPKVDLVVVPDWSGAMENPGLVTVASGFAQSPTTGDARRLLALVIAHELAHLWFGDLVTLTGWQELWINEGLATWMADRTLSSMTPPWRLPIERATEAVEAMLDDRAPAVHALRPRAIGDSRMLFDRLSYDKGAALIHGLEAWLGADPVRRALHDYLDAHAWQSTDSEGLIAALATIDPRLPIAEVVNDAISVPGVPLISAEVSCSPDAATLTVRAIANPRRVVVCARWGGGAARDGRACAIATANPQSIALGPQCPGWVVPDAGAAGYYRWQLPARWWRALATAPLTAAEQRGAIEAAVEAIAERQLSLDDGAAVLARAVATADRRLVEPAARWLRVLDAVAADDGARARLAKRTTAATDRALRTLGRTPVKGEDGDRARARRAVLELSGTVGADRATVRWADKVTAAWLRGALQPEALTGVALVVTARRGPPRRRPQLVGAVKRGGPRVAAQADALGRALTVLPDPTVAELLTFSQLPPTDLQVALIGALLEDPRRATVTLAQLGDRAGLIGLNATAVPCVVPPPLPRPPPPWLAISITRHQTRQAVAAAQCQALTASQRP